MAITFRETLAMRLRGAYLRMHKAANAVFAAHGATADQFVLLSILAEEDGLSQRELAIRNHTDANTIAAMVALLERRGLVRRRTGADDARVKCVSLTAAGQKLQRKLAEHSAEYHANLERLVPAEFRSPFCDSLARIAAIQDSEPQLAPPGESK
jgi:MarR family transcriptional regulator, organic hydroperoxide resistance regulator